MGPPVQPQPLQQHPPRWCAWAGSRELVCTVLPGWGCAVRVRGPRGSGEMWGGWPVAQRDPIPPGLAAHPSRLGSLWVPALALLGWVGVVAPVKINVGNGLWPGCGKSSTWLFPPHPRHYRQILPSPCPWGWRHPGLLASPGSHSGPSRPGCRVQWCEWPLSPVSPCPSPGPLLSAGPAQLPRPPGSISPAAFLPPGACRVPSSPRLTNLLPLPNVLPDGGKWERMF